MADEERVEEVELETTIDESVIQAEIDRALAGEVETAPAGKTEEVAEEVPAAATAETSAEETIVEEEPFIGRWKKAEVESLLSRLEGFDPDGLRTQLERALSGHLGQVGKRVKMLEEAATKEWALDPSSLDGLKELDEGLHEKLLEGLQKGLKIQSADPAALFAATFEERMTERDTILQAQMNDAVEERLLLRFVPDAYRQVQTPEWAEFYGSLKQEEQEALINWNRTNEQGQRLLGLRNAEPVIELMSRFQQAQNAKAEETQRKNAKLEANARPAKAAPRGYGGMAAAAKSAEEYDPAEAQKVIDQMLAARR
jgi:hypothetical protein